MSYATLMVYVNADHVPKQLVGVAADVANKFSARLIGLSALAVVPPFVAEGVVIVDNASEFDIARMKACGGGKQVPSCRRRRARDRMAIVHRVSDRDLDW
jgi:hypothetical protein